MIKSLIAFLFVLAAAIIGISIYLQPDDIASCNGTTSSTEPCRPVDAIVAISGGDTNARTDEAISLYNKGWASTLIFSGAAQDKSGPSNAAAMQARAIAAGVPQSVIHLDEFSQTTRQNAENSQTIFSNLNIKSIILVTSGYHQRRASLEFNKRTVGIKIINHPVASDRDWSMWWWTNPRGWALASSELFKIVVFKLGASQ
jgi:uncharacterized SAM-binding protein YcdF (DUF218 family)